MRKGTWITAVLALAPLAVIAGPAMVLGRQTHLVRRHECPSLPCVRDVDGDGRADRISIARPATVNPATDGDVMVRVGTRAVRVAPYNWVDGSWKTHVAVVPRRGGPPHVVVWDGTDERGITPVSGAWSWRGGGLRPVAHTRLDGSVARAMASYDDKGTFWWRLMVEVLAWIALPGWWILMLIVGATARQIRARPWSSARALAVRHAERR